VLLFGGANDKITRAFEKQRPVKDRKQDDEREQTETNSLKPPARPRLREFAGRAHARRVGVATAADSGIAGWFCIHAQTGVVPCFSPPVKASPRAS
jgi:hypothetical protein